MVLEYLEGLGITIRDITIALLLLIIALVLAWITGRYVRLWMATRISQDLAKPISRLISAFILITGLILALREVGVDLSSILVAGGLLAIAVGFAAQTTISSLLSGLLLYVDRPFKIGEAIAVGNNFGVVEDITVFSTRIRTFDGRMLRIPNDEIFKSTIVNLTATKARRVEYQIILPHDVDVSKATTIVKGLLEKHPLVLAEPQPTVFSNQATVDGVVLSIWAWVPARKFFDVWTELFMRIREELAKEGIKPAVPQRLIRVRQE